MIEVIRYEGSFDMFGLDRLDPAASPDFALYVPSRLDAREVANFISRQRDTVREVVELSLDEFSAAGDFEGEKALVVTPTNPRGVEEISRQAELHFNPRAPSWQANLAGTMRGNNYPLYVVREGDSPRLRNFLQIRKVLGELIFDSVVHLNETNFSILGPEPDLVAENLPEAYRDHVSKH